MVKTTPCAWCKQTGAFASRFFFNFFAVFRCDNLLIAILSDQEDISDTRVDDAAEETAQNGAQKRKLDDEGSSNHEEESPLTTPYNLRSATAAKAAAAEKAAAAAAKATAAAKAAAAAAAAEIAKGGTGTGSSSNNGSGGSVVNIPTSNQFDGLEEEHGDDSISLRSITPPPILKIGEPTKVKKVRVPPISVIGKSTRQLREFLGRSKIQQTAYNMKATKTGVQLMCAGDDSYRAAVEALRLANIQFHTYTPSTEQPMKVVLSGLPVYDTDELETELAVLGVNVSELKLFSRKTVGLEESALYLLHFPKGTVKLADLQKIRAIFNIVVRWRYFERKPDDAVQCHRCQRFGHGMRNCNLGALCVKCGGKHLSADCSLPNKVELAKVDKNATRETIKCANCSGQHTANYRGCPTRKNYLAKLAEKKAEARKVQPPPLRPIRKSGNVIPSSTPVDTSALSFADALSQGGSNNNSNLFTMSEFLAVAREVFARLKSCKSRQDQLEALVELTAKFIYSV